MNRMVDGVKYYEQFSENASRLRDEVSNKAAGEIFRDWQMAREFFSYVGS